MSASQSPIPSETTTRKKKLRKGANSCRECKRRKTRCIYLSPKDAICVGCQRRGTTCLSQELGDEVIPNQDDSNLRTRLIQVEALLAKVVGKLEADDPDWEDNAGTKLVLQKNAPNENCIAQQTRISSPSKRPQHIVPHDTTVDSEHRTIRQTLYAALPSQQAANVIMGTNRASLYLQVLCNPHAAILSGNVIPSSTLTTLPAATSHPVLLARKLLQIATCIQQFGSSIDESELGLPESPDTLMLKYVDLASNLVTTKDTFIDSLEGMECLVLEGTYIINSGSLRRAWLLVRRAMGIAQFMGFHRKDCRPPKALDPNTRVSCSTIWFRIIYAERYLSLLLSIPSAITDKTFASEEILAGASSTDRFERVHAHASGLILDRNANETTHEFNETQKIDYDLQQASKSVPAQWWLPPNYEPTMEAVEMMANMIRAKNQIIHYHLLILLHLPYMLRSSLERRYDYSKITCVSASREIINRFIHFRSFIKVATCCRLVDFSAFTAILTLLLANIGGKLEHFINQSADQRLVDRILVEKAMSTMEELSRVNGDALSKQTAEIARKLLVLEADTRDTGGIYTIRKVVDADQRPESGDNSYSLQIPYFGTINISPEESQSLISHTSVDNSIFTNTPSSSIQPEITGSQPVPYANQDYHDWDQAPFPIRGQQHTGQMSNTSIYFQDGLRDLLMPDITAEYDDWAFQGVDTGFFDALMRGDTSNQVPAGDCWTNWDILS